MVASFDLPEVTNQTGPAFGVYVGELTDAERGIPGAAEFGSKERCKLVYTIRQVIDSNDANADDWIGKDVWVFMPFPERLGPRTKLREHVTALAGRELAEGERPKFDDLLGKRVKLTYGPNDKGNSTVVAVMAHAPKARRQTAEDDY